MQLGKVVGSVWSTAKSDTLQGRRLLIVQPCTPEGEPSGRQIVCCDATGEAGAGELVYSVRGVDASYAFLPDAVATDHTIVAIVDELRVDRDAKREE